jgi:ferredoxin-type protein NapH
MWVVSFLNMPHNMFVWPLLGFAFLSVILIIVKKWVIPARGFTQLALFTLGEFAFVCNKGIPCSNCPLSFGICPIGTVQRIAFIPYSPLYMVLAIVVITGLVFGTLACGWACPVGFVQDVLHSPRLKEIRITNKLKVLRYFTLLLSIVLVFLELRFNFLSRRGIGVFHEMTVIGGALLLTTAIFIKRPFCRMLCPLGLIYGKLNKLSPIRVPLDKHKCTSCGACDKVCISDIKPAQDVNGDLCAKCYNCLKVCRT